MLKKNAHNQNEPTIDCIFYVFDKKMYEKKYRSLNMISFVMLNCPRFELLTEAS